MNTRQQIDDSKIPDSQPRIAACRDDSIQREPAAAQDWFKTGTGLGVIESSRRRCLTAASSRRNIRAALEKTFHDVLWADLEYSGILDLVSPSFYPSQVPSQPSELKAPDWANAPANAYMLAYGNLIHRAERICLVAGFLSDVHNPTAPLALQKVYRGQPATPMRARTLAHQFADDIIGRLERRPTAASRRLRSPT